MTYFRSIFFNFLIVFMVNRLAPGIQIELYEKVPNIGASLLFSLVVGFINGSVFPLLFIAGIRPSKGRIAVITFLVSFIAFISIAIFPFGVRAVSALGVLLGGGLVWAVAFLTNYFEWHRGAKGP